ncbi:MAG: ParA family protein [Holosporaceae bacterium]|jgi:chromosome partitioning protein|nr:ParA family protein [Holosporaceae bacterium]
MTDESTSFPKTTQVVAVINQKGGVGKTTTVVNLATAIAAIGKEVLVLDLDPQGNATTGFGISKGRGLHSSYGVLLGLKDPREVIQKTYVAGLHIIPSTIDLSAAEVELFSQKDRDSKLKQSISQLSYDYIFIDCPPGFGLISINALNASTKIIIPLQCEFYALEGLAQLFSTIQSVRNTINKNLIVSGILLTMYDRRNSLSSIVASDVRAHFKNLVFETVIPRNVRISEASSYGKPVVLYDVKSSGAISYIELAREFLGKEVQ